MDGFLLFGDDRAVVRPVATPPRMRFLFVGPQLWLQLPSAGTSRVRRPASGLVPTRQVK